MITAKTPTAIRRKPAVTAATPHGRRQPCRISHDTIGSRPSAKTSARTTALPAVKAAPKIRRVGHLGSARRVPGGGTPTGAAPVDPVAPSRSFAALAGGCGSLGSEVDTPTPPDDHPPHAIRPYPATPRDTHWTEPLDPLPRQGDGQQQAAPTRTSVSEPFPGQHEPSPATVDNSSSVRPSRSARASPVTV